MRELLVICDAASHKRGRVANVGRLEEKDGKWDAALLAPPRRPEAGVKLRRDNLRTQLVGNVVTEPLIRLAPDGSLTQDEVPDPATTRYSYTFRCPLCDLTTSFRGERLQNHLSPRLTALADNGWKEIRLSALASIMV